jgi:hypothetical protein
VTTVVDDVKQKVLLLVAKVFLASRWHTVVAVVVEGKVVVVAVVEKEGGLVWWKGVWG